MASHFAIVIEVPEMKPNPNTAATRAIIKNKTAQPSKPDKPFLFMFSSICITLFEYICTSVECLLQYTD